MTLSNGPTVLTLVIDAVGITSLEYLLDHSQQPVDLSGLAALGLGNLLDSRFHARVPPNPQAQFAHALEQASASADSVMGHRELMGIVDPKTYDLFPNGFPAAYIAELERRIGRKTFFNQMAEGTSAIDLNCEEHERTGCPIVYASVCDPLIQIAANETVIPPAELNRMTDTAFELAQEMQVRITRAISRPYVRSGEKNKRTANRHDIVLPMTQPCLVDILAQNGIYTVSVGKPAELVNCNNWRQRVKLTKPEQIDASLGLRFVHPERADTNPYSIQGAVSTLIDARAIYRPHGTFIFVNAVDTDSLWGHKYNVKGSLQSIEEISRCLGWLTKEMSPGDLLIVTADHGMRLVEKVGHHNKEPVPFLAMRHSGDLTGRQLLNPRTFTSVGYMIAQEFGLDRKYLMDVRGVLP